MNAEQWTQEEKQSFVDKLRAFRDRLPQDQRRAFNRILTGAAAAFRKTEALREDPTASALAESVAGFRKELSEHDRLGLDSVLRASSLAWGAEAGRLSVKPDSDQQLTTIAAIQFGLMLGIAAVGVAGLVIGGLIAGEDPEPEAPDLSNVPMSPEEPD